MKKVLVGAALSAVALVVAWMVWEPQVVPRSDGPRAEPAVARDARSGVVPSGAAAGFLIGAGLLGGIGQILLTSAYRYGDASVIAPFEYASMLFAIAIGYAVFEEVPTLGMLAGSAVLVAIFTYKSVPLIFVLYFTVSIIDTQIQKRT